MPLWLAALFAWLKSLTPDLVQVGKLLLAGRAGMELQKGREAEDALLDIELAAKAASRVDLLADADVVQQLKERSLYRLRGK